MEQKKKYRRYSRSFWENHVASWQTSGMTQKDYCIQNNLQQKSLSNWHIKISHPKEKDDTFTAIPFNLYEPANEDRRMELLLGDTIRLRIREDMDRDRLRSIIQLLREMSC